MHIVKRFGAVTLLLALFGAAAAQQPEPPPPRDEEPSEETRREDMRKEVEEAVQAIQAYSAARRDQALQRARVAIDAMDARIAQLQDDWDRGAERMNASARATRDRAMADLRRQRAELAARYRSMQDSSAGAWSGVKDDFVSAYRRIAETLRQAWDESGERKPAQEPPADAPNPPDQGRQTTEPEETP
jgi:hypothetical protein